MKKASLRQGMDEFFPTKFYYDIMKLMVTKPQGQMRWYDLAAGNQAHGIKLLRMEKQGLIEKKERGLYQITAYGRKIVAAVDAYKAEMARKP